MVRGGQRAIRAGGSQRQQEPMKPCSHPGADVRFVEEGLPHARLGVPHVRSPSRLGTPVPYSPGPRAALATGSPAGALLARPPPVCPRPSLRVGPGPGGRSPGQWWLLLDTALGQLTPWSTQTSENGLLLVLSLY